ncbi:hypothetical protein [Methylorubrum thiocyanatum]|uniref:hypothetical protein n=1 Tax=Methylorubrum thiocyanatum TaxID=47958 RepID=UPI0035C8048C
MRIYLAPVPPDRAAGVPGHAVGFVDPAISPLAGLRRAPPVVEGGEVLSYDGKRPHVGGNPVDHEDIKHALADEIARVAQRVFGPEYVGPMSLASGLSLRTVAKGRILSHGLPAPLLDMLGRASATEYPRATGYVLQAVAYMWDQHLDEFGAGEHGPGPMTTTGRRVLAERLDGILARAVTLVDDMRAEAAAAKARNAARLAGLAGTEGES